MSRSCPSCGDRVENTYDCRRCGDAFCLDCRRPVDHDCDAGTTAGESASDLRESVGASVASLDEWSRPYAGRWRAVPWPLPVLVAVVAFPPAWLAFSGAVSVPALSVLATFALPLSWFVFGAHVYAERLTPEAASWTPSRVYYFPTVTAVVLGGFPLVGLGVTALVAYPLLLVTVLIYAVQRLRKSGGAAEHEDDDSVDAEATDDEITALLDEARTHAGTGREAAADGDHGRAAEAYERAIDRADRARERAAEDFPDRVPEIEDYLATLRERREDVTVEG